VIPVGYLHKVEDGIDTGPIVMQEKYLLLQMIPMVVANQFGLLGRETCNNKLLKFFPMVL
jgi:folate-dependent phosphoribosylglycinamide formyltransferase PurN